MAPNLSVIRSKRDLPHGYNVYKTYYRVPVSQHISKNFVQDMNNRPSAIRI